MTQEARTIHRRLAAQRQLPHRSNRPGPDQHSQRDGALMALPFGLTSIAASYKDALRDKFTDH